MTGLFQGLQSRSGALWVAPDGKGDERSSALLHSFALATTSPALACLGADCFSSCLTCRYHVHGILMLEQYEQLGAFHTMPHTHPNTLLSRSAKRKLLHYCKLHRAINLLNHAE